ncbi:TetR/AcrR family transcriptional regulator [Saccharothrix violaceirubra]|uniref:AcrR family transcriptional regulator n=1 Tax=Saccharothrix violaceirubra TaxID=413306 RepID=A0A7W7TA88_9PSEU|nr:TetR/AcrR family transcriptional regulator [Saccharothrix violaceirubra]MBB4969341.1 AcrR family transcriptional regulator [Saccharothrix violaceirubra]
MPPDAARRSERSRLAVLEAALELVVAVGYGRLTVEAVASRAGVGKQTIYRWWESKGALLFDAFVELGPVAVVGGVRRGEVVDDLTDELLAAVAEVCERRFDQVCRALVHEGRTDLVMLLLAPRRVAVEERLAVARRLGEVRRDLDLGMAVELLLGPLYQRWLLRTAPLTPDFVETLVDVALGAFR